LVIETSLQYDARSEKYQIVRNAPTRLPEKMRGGYEDIRNSRKSGGDSNPTRILTKRKQACILVIVINESTAGCSETTVHVYRIAWCRILCDRDLSITANVR